MKIVLVTQNAPIYLGPFVDATVSRLLDAGHEVNGIVAFSPTFKKTFAQALYQRWKYYGPVDFFRMSFHVAWNQMLARLAKLWPELGCFSISNARQRHRIPSIDVLSINSTEFREYLVEQEVDVVLSIASPQIFRRKLLETPPQGCVNYHMGMLPRFRGRQPLFWALLHGETEVGLSVHMMDAEIDNGPIVMQETILVEGRDSLHGLYLKCIRSGPALVAKAIEHLASGNEARIPNDARQATYFGFPTHQDVKIFRDRGRRFF